MGLRSRAGKTQGSKLVKTRNVKTAGRSSSNLDATLQSDLTLADGRKGNVERGTSAPWIHSLEAICS